ncbi:molybdopterin-dependent oxidoreductase [uncultured Adlercreutzia sp.]|uniref:molybdopterin-dependent oxidoreductase n=1 Tax=uncultured Adlercreutzia sp. TaxID=875803 RepID=UPI0025F167C6|nr:molybdopterin-dependent oxidoreductase [uncultured Adlercreutzia sp.]
MGENGLNVSRRGFVAGAGAAAVGLGLAGCASGTAEKEGTDLANTSLVPEKMAYDPNAGEWIPTTCNMCFNNCSIKAHVIDGVVVELTGNPDSPIGNGHICGKGTAGIMQLYDPNRITKPLKRTNPKKGPDEDPGWVEIEWDEAFDIIDEKFSAAAAENPGNIGSFSMVSSQAGSLVKGMALGALYGTYEPANATADLCGTGVHQLSYIYTGAGNAMPDYKYCNYLIQFGTNAGAATRHGFNMTASLYSQRRSEGLRVVNFDPHMSAGAETADQWVPIKPSTDAAAANSIAYVLVHELDLIDREYLTNRTNGPALVSDKTQRVLRDKSSNKALYMDTTDNKAKPYDECAAPALEGTFTVDGEACTTGFTLYKEHIKKYTPEYQEAITSVPADTIRQVAKEFGEAACIGETIEIDGKTMPFRPACVDMFSGMTRHKHAFHACWSVIFLNVLVGSANSVGGLLGFDPACNGWTDDAEPYVTWRPAIWEEDGFIEDVSLMLAYPGSYYRNVREFEYVPTDMSMLGLQPIGADAQFFNIAQANPDLYHTQPIKVALYYGCNPIKWWANHDEMRETMGKLDFIVGIDLFLNDSSYYYDIFLPEANYLERSEPLPHFFLNHRVIGGLDVPWTIGVWQKVVEPKDGGMGIFSIMGELAHRKGLDANYIGLMNSVYRVKEEYSIPMDQKFDIEAFCDSVLKSLVDEEHNWEWFKANGVYTHPRDFDEMYIWADNAPGKVPLYWDFMFEAKEKIEASVKKLDIPWETDDYQPFPDWKPSVEWELDEPDFDLFPIYYTDSINVDSWSVENPYIDEINRENPYAYAIEMNAATAKAKGLADGDQVRLTSLHDSFVEGTIMTSEKIHPDCLSVIAGSWGSNSEFLPLAKGKGTAVAHLVPGRDPKRLDHICSALDQTVRVKIEKIS